MGGKGMICLNIVLMILDIVGAVVLIRKLKKNIFKRKYRLSDKREYYLNLWLVLLLAVMLTSCNQHLCSAYTHHSNLHHKPFKELRK
jgi:hypothetical protein